MYKFQIKKMKNLILKIATTISIFSLSLFSTKPVISDTYIFGSNTTKPDTLKVLFYQLGLTTSDFTNIFSVLDSESGVEVDISDQNSVNDLVTGITPSPGEYTHIYALISNIYKVKASSNGCYTKGVSVDQKYAVFDVSTYSKNGVTINNLPGDAWDGWLAASDDSNEFAQASLRDHSYGLSSNNTPKYGNSYINPNPPNTNISIGGLEVSSITQALTNSSNPYTITEATSPNELPPSSTRDRVLYYGELSSTVVVPENSNGIVQIVFDYSNGIAFSDDCSAVKFNSGDFDMSVITE